MPANQEFLHFVLGFSRVEVIFAHQRMTYLFLTINYLGDVDRHLFCVSADVHRVMAFRFTDSSPSKFYSKQHQIFMHEEITTQPLVHQMATTISTICGGKTT
jgi:hypothetical protein